MHLCFIKNYYKFNYYFHFTLYESLSFFFFSSSLSSNGILHLNNLFAPLELSVTYKWVGFSDEKHIPVISGLPGMSTFSSNYPYWFKTEMTPLSYSVPVENSNLATYKKSD